jgi:hypothetical protein
VEELDVLEKEEVNWHDEGVEAGKTDGWMNLEETLSADIEHHPAERDAVELVQAGIDGWEQTDHFTLLYGSKMWGDARDKVGADADGEEVIEAYQDYRTEFWEGYLTGRKSIGVDVYARAKKLLSARKKLSTGRGKSKQERASAKASVKGLRG